MKMPCTAIAENVTNKSISMPEIPRAGKDQRRLLVMTAMKKPDHPDWKGLNDGLS